MLYNIQKMLHICEIIANFAPKKDTYLMLQFSPRHHG